MIVHVDPNPDYIARITNDETVHAKVEWRSPGVKNVTVEPLNVTENGLYTAPLGKAYNPVNVNVQGGGAPLRSVTVVFDFWQFADSAAWSAHAEEWEV